MMDRSEMAARSPARPTAHPAAYEAAVDGPVDPRLRRAARLGGGAALVAAERRLAGAGRDRRAQQTVAAIACARTDGDGRALARRVRRLQALRRAALRDG